MVPGVRHFGITRMYIYSIFIYIYNIALNLSIYKQNTVTTAFMSTDLQISIQKRKVHHLE